MKLFSLDSLMRHAGETFKRFPLALLSAIACTIVLLVHSHNDFSDGSWQALMPLAMALYLSLLLHIVVTFYAERFTFSGTKKYAAWLIAVAVMVLYYFSLPAVLNGSDYIRFVLFAIALHLLVSFAPFLVRGEMNGLWQFNKSVFIRILTSVLYSGVLFAGLALALAAVDKLFKLDIESNSYFNLWVVIAGIFNTWFFLSGVPRNLPSLNDETDYPKGLKIFTVYVLLPLITIYMTILYLYAGKIVITSDWPVGWVGYMVIAFAIAGILSFLLIYPLRDEESQPWVKFYSRLFYFLLIVPITLLFAAIFKRVNQYGITEERYFVLMLAFWLSFIVLYFIITNGKNIRIIPLTLCIVALLSSFGPWGAFSVSRNSQLSELTALLDSNHVLVNGKADTTKTHDIKSDDYDRIRNIISYINEVHGHKKLQSFFTQNLDSLLEKNEQESEYPRDDEYLIFDLLKIHVIYPADTASASSREPYYDFRVEEHALLHTSGYELVREFFMYGRHESKSKYFLAGGDTIRLSYSDKPPKFILSSNAGYDTLVIDADDFFSSLRPFADRAELGEDKLTVEADNRQWKAKIIFTKLYLSLDEGKLSMTEAHGILLVSITTRRDNEVGEKGTK